MVPSGNLTTSTVEHHHFAGENPEIPRFLRSLSMSQTVCLPGRSTSHFPTGSGGSLLASATLPQPEGRSVGTEGCRKGVDDLTMQI